jgi:DNA-binding CsgD family transcriptional regulator
MCVAATLEHTEVKVLACVVGGMSRKDVASCFGLSLDEVPHMLQSAMRKLTVGMHCRKDCTG